MHAHGVPGLRSLSIRLILVVHLLLLLPALMPRGNLPCDGVCVDLVQLLLQGHLTFLVVAEGLQPPLDLLILVFLLLFLPFHSGLLNGRVVLIEMLVLAQF